MGILTVTRAGAHVKKKVAHLPALRYVAPMTVTMTIATEIRRIRVAIAAAGIARSEVARRLGWSPQRLSKTLHGRFSDATLRGNLKAIRACLASVQADLFR